MLLSACGAPGGDTPGDVTCVTGARLIDGRGAAPIEKQHVLDHAGDAFQLLDIDL